MNLVELFFKANTQELDAATAKLKDMGGSANQSSGQVKGLTDAITRVDETKPRATAHALQDVADGAKKGKDETSLLGRALQFMGGQGGVVGQVAGKFRDIEDRVKSATVAMKGLNTEMLLVSSVGRGLAIGIGVSTGAVLVAGAVAAGLAIKYKEVINNLGDLASAHNTSSSLILEMQLAMEAVGTTRDSYLSTLDAITKSLHKTGDDTDKTGAAFAQLGVAISDNTVVLDDSLEVVEKFSQLRAPHALFLDIIEGFERSAKTSADFDAVTKLTGKTIAELRTELAGLKEAEELRKFTLEHSLGLSEEGAEATGEYATAQSKLTIAMTKMGDDMVRSLLPTMSNFIELIAESTTKGGVLHTTFRALRVAGVVLATVFNTLVSVVDLLFTALRDLFGLVKDGMNVVWSTITNGLAGGKTAIDELVANYQSKTKGLADNVKTSVGLIKDAWASLNNGDPQLDKVEVAAPGTKTAAEIRAEAEAEERKKQQLAREREQLAKEAAAAAAKFAADQIKATGQFAAVQRKQIEQSYELQGIDVDRINYQNQLIEASNQIVGLAEKDRQLAVENAMELYDRNQLMKQLTLDMETQSKLREKAIADERRLNEMVQSSVVKSNEALAKARGTFEDRFLPKKQREQRDVSRNVVEPLQAQRRSDLSIANNPTSSSDEVTAARARVAVLDETIARQLESVNTLIVAQTAAENTFQEGINRAITQATDNIPTVADAVAGLVTNTAASLENTLFDVFAGGELTLKSFFRTLISQLLKLQIQLMIIKPLMMMFGGGLGGGAAPVSSGTMSMFSASTPALGSGISGIKLFASGGVVNSPTMFGMGTGLGVAGEAGPEGILPLKRGRNGDLGVIATMGGGASNQINNITVNVTGGNNNEDTGAVVSAKIVEAMKGIARQEISTAKRVGGSLNPI